MQNSCSRSQFIKTTALAGLALAIDNSVFSSPGRSSNAGRKRVGIIGLDTSHSLAFIEALNAADAGDEYLGYKIVCAYPYGSRDIKTSAERIPDYVQKAKAAGIEIVDSIAALLEKTDVVMLETNDGRMHLEQALPVFKAGKRLFIDKPLAASLKDGIAIVEASKKYNTPFFSSSSLRYNSSLVEIMNGRAGKILGAYSYSPAALEKTHPDFFWYGIHGVEILYTIMGTGCKSVTRVSTPDADVVTGIWNDNRVGTFRGTRTGPHEYGGIVFGDKATLPIGPYDGYKNLLKKIVAFFDSGIVPVAPEETLEMLSFMEAADESKRNDGRMATLAFTNLPR